MLNGRLLSLGAGLGLALVAGAEVKLPHVFGHDMVLQQGQKVPVWGTAAAGEKVTVSFAGQRVEAIADGQGKWRVDLAPLAASAEGRTFIVDGAYGEQISSVSYTNVVVGEVWFCSGQSNMAYTMSSARKVKGWETEVPNADYPLLRHFRVHRKTSPVPLADVEAKWEPTTPQTVPPQSAVAYFFGKTLMADLKVPVGLINCSWGGTRIEPWTPAGHPDDLWMLQHANTWGRTQDVPTVLWNGMVAGLVPYAIKGAIWYQGCSNLADGDVYLDKTVCLVRGWRREWGQGDFPYFLVQLAPYRYNDVKDTRLAIFQEAQARVPEVVPNSGYTVINDVGNVNDIHPTDKVTVGRRLADQALDRVYGKPGRAWKTPTFKCYRVEGNALRVTLNDAEGLTTRDGQAPNEFELRDISGRWLPAQAKIDGCDVVLRAEGVEAPAAMRFAAYNGSTPNLVNGAGLPVGPFRCGVKLALGAAEKLPELKGFTCVQRYDIPVNCNLAVKKPTTLASRDGVTRVAYLLEAEREDGEVLFAFAAMDAFAAQSDALVLTGKPGARQYRETVKNLVVRSNAPGVASRDGGIGFVEFYTSSYGARRMANPEGGDDKKYDFNDTPVNVDRLGYGCLQVHDLKAKATVLAFNNINKSNVPCDIGFGTNPSGNPDWTFSRNGGQFKARRISVWVK